MCDWKKILMGSLAGAMLLPVLYYLIQLLLSAVFPFNPFELPGVRPLADPLGWWYLAYPLVLSFAAAFTYDWVYKALPGKGVAKGLVYGGLLFLLITIPNLFMLFSTMTYPPEFYPHMIARDLAGYAALGIIFAHVWKK